MFIPFFVFGFKGIDLYYIGVTIKQEETMGDKNTFWNLPFEEREIIVKDRMKRSKYVVWDYARSKEDNSFGMIEALGNAIDKGCVHGFTMYDSKAVLSPKWKEFNVYTDNWYLDEKFENRTLYPYHFFSNYDDAVEYSEKAKEYAMRNGLDYPTLGDILPIIQKYDKSFQIIKGKRGYECGEEYTAISNGTITTFTIDDNGNIIMNRGQMFDSFIITHIDMLDKVLDIFYNGKYKDSNDRLNAVIRYCCYF